MPGQISVHKNRASVSLKFIVVGGSIAGLATAYTLRKAGHSVLIIEKSDGHSVVSKCKGGLRSPPNMTRILNQWGLAPALAKMSHKCDTFTFHNGANGEPIGSVIMQETFLVHLLADFLFIEHSELHYALHELASEAGVKFMFQADVVDADSESVSVTLGNGEKLKADVIVGADGYDSFMRGVVTGEYEGINPPPDTCGKRLWVTFSIPTAVLEGDEDLRPFANPLVWTLFLGDGYILRGHLLAGGKEFSVSLVYTYNGPLKEGDEEWKSFSSLDQWDLDYSRFEPRPLKLLKSTNRFSARIVRVRPHLESLVCDEARIVLVGEAAHPLLPSGFHSTGLGLEDALTLGNLFSRITNRNQVSQLLTAYEEIRQPRVASVHAHEVQQQAMLTVPAVAMHRRDDVMRKALAYEDWEHMDEATFKMVWGGVLDICTHDASESVDDWWTQWGAYFEHTDRRGSVSIPSTVQTSVA